MRVDWNSGCWADVSGGLPHPSPEKMADRAIDDLTAKLELNTAQQQQLQMIKTELLGNWRR